ncbi:hypothetical protein [Streptomyces sp. Tue6028]|uniref:hypothetical protein n=1 Tax=Streptomyces sp. Tue6028 TaxID=2036037 RepID=UPI003D70D5BC
MRNVKRSLQRVMRSKQPDAMAMHKYGIAVSGRPGAFQEKWWSPGNTPVIGEDGEMQWIIHHVEGMTDFVLARPLRLKPRGLSGEHEAVEAEPVHPGAGTPARQRRTSTGS